jgi:hypothetical protein
MCKGQLMQLAVMVGDPAKGVIAVAASNSNGDSTPLDGSAFERLEEHLSKYQRCVPCCHPLTIGGETCLLCRECCIG